MKKTMMYLPEEMHAFLVEEASRRGVSMAEVAREAIAEYGARRSEVANAGISELVGFITPDDRRTNDAERIDDVLGEYYGEGGSWEQENGLADRP
jgi:hypothetical protein